MNADPLLIYGATGFTGGLIVESCVKNGLKPILAGRNASKLREVAAPFGLEHREARLDDSARLDEVLRGVKAVLHAAGPFSETSPPMVDACLRAGAHYLDVTGEVDVFEALARRHDEARRRGVMLLPGVGYDVVATDCLAAHVTRRLPSADRLAIGIAGLRYMTPASAKTFVGHAGRGVKIRRNGVLAEQAPGRERLFDFDGRLLWAVHVSLPDVVSAYYTTGIPEIAGYYEATPAMRTVVNTWRYFGLVVAAPAMRSALETWTDALWRGPSSEQRQRAPTVIVAEAERLDGRRAISRLRTPEPYTTTAVAAAAIARRVLGGDVEVGFETPGRLFGADFVLSFDGVTREDLS